MERQILLKDRFNGSFKYYSNSNLMITSKNHFYVKVERTFKELAGKFLIGDQEVFALKNFFGDLNHLYFNSYDDLSFLKKGLKLKAGNYLYEIKSINKIKYDYNLDILTTETCYGHEIITHEKLSCPLIKVRIKMLYEA